MGFVFVFLTLFKTSGLFACLFERDINRESTQGVDVELGGWGGGEDLKGAGRGEMMIRIYRLQFFSIKKKRYLQLNCFHGSQSYTE